MNDNVFLDVAEIYANQSTCLRRAFGAVLVRDGEIISTGFNNSPDGELGCKHIGRCERIRLNIPAGQQYELCRSVHAEQNALLKVSRDQAKGSTLYLVGKNLATGEYEGSPCKICTRFIKMMRLEKIIVRQDKENFKVLQNPEDLDYGYGG